MSSPVVVVLLLFVLVVCVAAAVATRNEARTKVEDTPPKPADDETRRGVAIAIVNLMRYVAAGDRRIDDREKLAILAASRMVYPGFDDIALGVLLKMRLPEVEEVMSYGSIFSMFQEDIRLSIYRAVETVAGADRKVTPGERSRLTIAAQILDVTEPK